MYVLSITINNNVAQNMHIGQVAQSGPISRITTDHGPVKPLALWREWLSWNALQGLNPVASLQGAARDAKRRPLGRRSIRQYRTRYAISRWQP